MANAIGYVEEHDIGFHGYLSMLNLTAPIRIERNLQKRTENQPDYIVLAGETECEIGGAWLRKAKRSGREFLALTFADPQIGPRRIRANLAPVTGEIGRYVVLWNPE